MRKHRFNPTENEIVDSQSHSSSTRIKKESNRMNRFLRQSPKPDSSRATILPLSLHPGGRTHRWKHHQVLLVLRYNCRRINKY